MTIFKKKQWIYVTLQKEGVHRYPAAETDPKLKTGGWDDVSFLAVPHRHIFHINFRIEVFHDDRDLEFIQVKRQIQKWVDEEFISLDYKSCEMIAEDIFVMASDKWPGRDMVIQVSEDNENGCVVEYLKKE